MERSASSPWRFRVHRALRALGGHGTLGDVVALTGLGRHRVEEALDDLMAVGCADVSVTASGDVVYHAGEGPSADGEPTCDTPGADPIGFDRKTVQLIRAREGVISLAELVEHTGLPLVEAEVEMQRLADCYGGVSHVSIDGHVVHAFPELMSTTRGSMATREPRPAWVRFQDPIRSSRRDRVRDGIRVGAALIGLVGAAAAPWMLRAADGGVFLLVTGISAVTLVACGKEVVRAVEEHRLFRFRRMRSVRRYLLGLVVETALAGKGVVSLERAVRYLKARAGRRRVSRSAVESALRSLAVEFDAPVTELGGDVFFGFRNVKRQFLASVVVRRRMRLARFAQGETIFDSADPPLVAAQRELDAFDRELQEGRAS